MPYLGTSYLGFGGYSTWLVNGLNFDFTLTTSQTELPSLTIGQDRFTNASALVYRDLVPMEPFGDRHDKLIPDESLPPSHYAQLTSDVPGLPGTLEAREVTGPDIGAPQPNRITDVKTAASQVVGSAANSPFLAEQGQDSSINFPVSEWWTIDLDAIVQKWQAARQAARQASQRFWDGVIAIAGGQDQPTLLLKWNRSHGTWIVHENSFDTDTYRSFFNTIYFVDDTTINAADRVVGSGYDPARQTVLGGVYNEAFHAWYFHKGPGWLVSIFASQSQYPIGLDIVNQGRLRFNMGEEAMS